MLEIKVLVKMVVHSWFIYLFLFLKKRLQAKIYNKLLGQSKLVSSCF